MKGAKRSLEQSQKAFPLYLSNHFFKQKYTQLPTLFDIISQERQSFSSFYLTVCGFSESLPDWCVPFLRYFDLYKFIFFGAMIFVAPKTHLWYEKSSNVPSILTTSKQRESPCFDLATCKRNRVRIFMFFKDSETYEFFSNMIYPDSFKAWSNFISSVGVQVQNHHHKFFVPPIQWIIDLVTNKDNVVEFASAKRKNL